MLVPALFAFTVRDLPAVNATLNAAATLLLVTGYLLVRSGRERAHKVTMIAAFAVSILFLISYLIYHTRVGSVPFRGPIGVRELYLVVLTSHIVLAAAVPILAGASIYLGWRDKRRAHRRLSRWTLPIWLYVSVTGVFIYWMLYHAYPAKHAVAL